MNEFEESRIIAFNLIKSFESVEKLTSEKLRYYKLERFIEAWRLKIEVVDGNNEIKEVTLFLCFKFDFPLSIPIIYLSSSDYDRLKYIPHIDTNRLICTFDTEVTKTDIYQPGKIVLECINRAKTIINKGIKKENFQDFDEEFLSYWQCNYSKNDLVLENYLCLIDPLEKIKSPCLLILESNLKGFKYVIHNNNVLSDRFKTFLKEKKIRFSEQIIFYFEFEKKDFLPPYNLSNSEIIKIFNSIDQSLVKEYELYINNPKTEIGLVLANYKSDKNKILIGWVSSPFDINKKAGFRPKSIKPFEAFSKYQSNNKIIRIIPEVYTPNRLSKRTSGLTQKTKYKFLISGIGSVGSHLISFLNSMNVPEFRLVDNDYLEVENIGRHFLGFNSIKKHKTLGMKDYLNELNPLQEIKTFEKSIIDVAINDISFLNNSDYIFVSTGKENIDLWLFKLLKKGEIKKPLFIIWVEPYLAGGHVIYLNPNDMLEYEKLFVDNIYKYNIINAEYYFSQENSIALKEAGCQTTYVPYSSQNLMLFMAGVFPFISSIITNSSIESKIFTWIGDLAFLTANSIDISAFAKSSSFGIIIENHD